MAGNVKVNQLQLGDSVALSQNFVLKTNADGTAGLYRNTDASGGAILTIDASGNVSAAVSMQQGGVAMPRMVLGTAQATTSGTSIDFTGIPSWVKRITVSMAGTSTNGTSNLRLQIGPSGGVETSGYLGSSAIGTTYGLDTGGFSLTAAISAASVSSGVAVLVLLDAATNTWAYQSNLGYSNGAGASYAGGSKAIAGVLSRLRLTTVNGTDTFDAGSVNILYEG